VAVALLGGVVEDVSALVDASSLPDADSITAANYC
jgi:hypothetical protein